MSKLNIKNIQKQTSSIVFQETFRDENLNNCEGSYVNFSLTGQGSYFIKMTYAVTPGGGYVTLTTTGNIIKLNGNMVSSVQFYPGWSYPNGGDHSRIDDIEIILNGTSNFVLTVTASSTGIDEQNQLVLLQCWDGMSSMQSAQANCTLENSGIEILHLLNIKHFNGVSSGQQPI